MTTKQLEQTPLDEHLPPLTYGELKRSLEMVCRRSNEAMIPYLVSALREQAPFLSGQLILFEILRSAHCIADEPVPFPAD